MKLTPKQSKAITLLASGKKCCDVAAELSISPQTISEWKKQPEFISELNQIQMEVLDSARIKIQQAAVNAAISLIEIAQASPNLETRRKASIDILRIAGYEPDSVQLYGRGIGPETLDEAQEQLEKREYRKKMAAARRAAGIF